uniref:Uncharacterized protein n=1 Tax=Octopus bimaculoides TaxID=37653 RepID=A0A0L8FXH5_OCTBM
MLITLKSQTLIHSVKESFYKEFLKRFQRNQLQECVAHYYEMSSANSNYCPKEYRACHFSEDCFFDSLYTIHMLSENISS